MSNKESYGIVGNRCFGSACGAGWLTVLPESRPWSLGAGQTGTACRRWRKTVGVVSRCTSCAQRPVAAFGLSGRRRPSKSRPATLRSFSQDVHQSRSQTGRMLSQVDACAHYPAPTFGAFSHTCPGTRGTMYVWLLRHSAVLSRASAVVTPCP